MIDYDKEYQNYLEECKKIPRHLKNKLDNMPNNKGFIYNGIWLFGNKKSTSNKIIIMFEKDHNYIYIHEITLRNYKITSMNLFTKEKVVSFNQQRYNKKTMNFK
jgi:hypothetical protein